MGASDNNYILRHIDYYFKQAELCEFFSTTAYAEEPLRSADFLDDICYINDEAFFIYGIVVFNSRHQSKWLPNICQI